jgi:hypothetical protein
MASDKSVPGLVRVFSARATGYPKLPIVVDSLQLFLSAVGLASFGIVFSSADHFYVDARAQACVAISPIRRPLSDTPGREKQSQFVNR